MTTAESTSNLSIQAAPMSGSLNSAHLARKRRREKMRGGNTTNIIKSVDAVPDESLSCTSKESQAKGILPPKKRKYSVDHSDSSISSSNIDTKTKKKVTLRSKSQTKSMRPGVSTQKRYDPDVPMTKEEASAWRREARRVRNRESAAASRRKIRDKIEVLEEEVEEWKAKYEAVMRKLQEVSESSKVALDQNGSWVAGPCVSPPLHPKESPVNVLPSISVNSTSYPGRSDGNDQHHLIETILRPAES